MLVFWRQSVTKKTKFHIWSHQRLIHNYWQYNCSLWGISYRGCRIFRQWKTVIKDVQKCFKLILKDGKHVESRRWQEGKGTAKCAKESDLVTKDCSVLLLLPGFYLGAFFGNGKKEHVLFTILKGSALFSTDWNCPQDWPISEVFSISFGGLVCPNSSLPSSGHSFSCLLLLLFLFFLTLGWLMWHQPG